MTWEDTERPVHYGVNLVIVPEIQFDNKKALQFEAGLSDRSLNFSQRTAQPKALELAERGDEPLRVILKQAGGPAWQLIIVCEEPKTTRLATFMRQASEVVSAFRTVWPNEPKQVVHKDATMRFLYQPTSEHAFTFLWEERLGQAGDDLECFGRPVLGGGLRFVMPPSPRTGHPEAIECKIESYLRDPKMLFVEVQAGWNLPEPIDTLSVDTPLRELEGFVRDRVYPFINKTVDP